MSSFEAMYPGTCAVCDGAIKVGQLATFTVMDEIAHVICPEVAPPKPPCDKCFMVPAANGLCGCDE